MCAWEWDRDQTEGKTVSLTLEKVPNNSTLFPSTPSPMNSVSAVLITNPSEKPHLLLKTLGRQPPHGRAPSQSYPGGEG